MPRNFSGVCALCFGPCAVSGQGAQFSPRMPVTRPGAVQSLRVWNIRESSPSTAEAAVRAALDIPVVGTVPAIKPAALSSKSRVIGVLGTDATVRQPYVDRLAAEHGADCTILRHGSAALVALAESKLRGESLDPEIAKTALLGLIDQPRGNEMDSVVLACTHFPLVQDELEAAARELGARPLAFLHGGDGIARRIDYLNAGAPWPDTPPKGVAVFTQITPDVEALKQTLERYSLFQINAL